jgi:hypothetical protein
VGLLIYTIPHSFPKSNLKSGQFIVKLANILQKAVCVSGFTQTAFCNTMQEINMFSQWHYPAHKNGQLNISRTTAYKYKALLEA